MCEQTELWEDKAETWKAVSIHPQGQSANHHKLGTGYSWLQSWGSADLVRDLNHCKRNLWNSSPVVIFVTVQYPTFRELRRTISIKLTGISGYIENDRFGTLSHTIKTHVQKKQTHRIGHVTNCGIFPRNTVIGLTGNAASRVKKAVTTRTLYTRIQNTWKCHPFWNCSTSVWIVLVQQWHVTFVDIIPI